MSYVLARKGVAFLKYPAFHALAESQGVDVGSSYRSAECAKTFMHFIAEKVSVNPFFTRCLLPSSLVF